MEGLAAPAIDVVERDQVRITPDQHKRVYLEWMRKIRPWCVSRQLWWGHRIPVWYGPGGEEIVAESAELARAAAAERGLDPDSLSQESDVLDTWFSSALWPFATLGWPDEDSPHLRALLSHERAGDRPRHPLSLGGADGDDGARVHRQGPVPRGLHHADHPGARRKANVEVAWNRDRPPRRDRGARRRCASLRPPGDGLDPGRALLGRPRAAGPRPRQQALQRLSPDPAQRCRCRARGPRSDRRGSLDRLAARTHHRQRQRRHRRLRVLARRPQPLLVLLVGGV